MASAFTILCDRLGRDREIEIALAMRRRAPACQSQPLAGAPCRRRAGTRRPHGGGAECDGPAAAWWRKASPPLFRWWICDHEPQMRSASACRRPSSRWKANSLRCWWWRMTAARMRCPSVPSIPARTAPWNWACANGWASRPTSISAIPSSFTPSAIAGRHLPAAPDGDSDARVVSVGYLALTRQGGKTAPSARDTRWRGWYHYFPWEDWREPSPR